MNNFSDKVSFIWSIADLIRDAFKRSKYQDVILPFTVLRRIDCVLQPSKARVLEVHQQLKNKLANLAPQLCKASGYAFYNTSPYDFERLLNDAPNLAANLKAYINGFSDNMREVLEKFDFNNTIAKEHILEINAKAEVHLFGQEVNPETFACLPGHCCSMCVVLLLSSTLLEGGGIVVSGWFWHVKNGGGYE